MQQVRLLIVTLPDFLSCFVLYFFANPMVGLAGSERVKFWLLEAAAIGNSDG